MYDETERTRHTGLLEQARRFLADAQRDLGKGAAINGVTLAKVKLATFLAEYPTDLGD